MALPDCVAKLSFRRAASAVMAVDYVRGGGAGGVRYRRAIPGKQLAAEPARLDRPCANAVDGADPALRLGCGRTAPVGTAGGGDADGAAGVPEIRLLGTAERHGLGNVGDRLPVHGLPVRRGGRGIAGRQTDQPGELDFAGRASHTVRVVSGSDAAAAIDCAHGERAAHQGLDCTGMRRGVDGRRRNGVVGDSALTRLHSRW